MHGPKVAGNPRRGRSQPDAVALQLKPHPVVRREPQAGPDLRRDAHLSLLGHRRFELAHGTTSNRSHTWFHSATTWRARTTVSKGMHDRAAQLRGRWYTIRRSEQW